MADYISPAGNVTTAKQNADFGGGTLRSMLGALAGLGAGFRPALPDTGGHGQIAGPPVAPAVSPAVMAQSGTGQIAGPANGKAAPVPTLYDALKTAGLTNRDLPALQSVLPAPRQMTFADTLKAHYATALQDRLAGQLQGVTDPTKRDQLYNGYLDAYKALVMPNPLNDALSQAISAQQGQ